MAILALIAYWVYRLIDKNSANELKDKIVGESQKTVTVDTWIKESFDYLFDNNKESLDNGTWKNIIISDPEIISPVASGNKLLTGLDKDLTIEEETNTWDNKTNSWNCTTQTVCTTISNTWVQNTGTIVKDTTTKNTTIKTTTTKKSSSYYNVLFQLFK